MSLPPGFLDELRTRTSLAQVVGRKVMWDMRKSNQGRGDMWAPCPFHQEKTASFHVDDRKGFYYCFGCHAKGDAISFVRETENVDFIEAVRILAAEAGMTMPERDPRAQEKADHRSELFEVMEMAVRHFRMGLQTGAGAAARDYLAGRGLDDAARDRFELGFAPDSWQDLWDYLTGRGVEAQKILDCGLARPSQKGGNPYDTFRNRIIFPIRDARGRCIAFGGRAMDPGDSAKYLNSPDTELFDKSRTLYNIAPAREAAGKGAPLIVAEGYMDVIALAQAGFGAAVAPLGTAVTEEQLQMLWRMADEPVIALDGDKAGLRAAWRVIDLALPLLEAGKSLRFALMPQGLDPDDLLRRQGPKALQAVLDAALPMVELLWRRETEGRSFDSPERRAALDKALNEAVARIRDPSIRHHYGQAVKDLRWKFFNPRRDRAGGKDKRGSGARGRPPAWVSGAPVRNESKASLLAAAGDEIQIELREAVVLATLILTPSLVDDFEARLERLPCTAPDHARLRSLILHHGAEGAEALRARIAQELGAEAVDRLCARPHVNQSPGVRRPGDEAVARQTITAALNWIDAENGLRAEVAEAEQDIAGLSDESVTYRLSEAARLRRNAAQVFSEDQADYEVADNGVRLKSDERRDARALFDSLLESDRPKK